MKKGEAGKIAIFAYNIDLDAPATGEAANITATISKDGAAPAATDDTNPTEIGGGLYYFNGTADELNADLLTVAGTCSTAYVKIDPVIIYPESATTVTSWTGPVNASIYNQVILSPDIKADIASQDDTEVADYVAGLIGIAQEFIAAQTVREVFPSHSAGYSRSGANASTDLSALASNEIVVTIDGVVSATIELTLANCTSGAATATELQTQLRAEGVAGGEEASPQWDGVTVSYSSTTGQYTITSPTYGPLSSVQFSYESLTYHVASAMKLGPTFGGEEVRGTPRDRQLEDVCVQTVVNAYRRARTAPSVYGSEPEKAALVSEAFASLDRRTNNVILSRRRLTRQ